MTKKEVIVPADDLVCLGKDKLQELIRCKNCVWYVPEDDSKYGQCQAVLGSYVTVENEHYCAWAKNK